MILVGAVYLVEEEWSLGESVTDEEFFKRYRPWLVPVHLRAEGQASSGRSTGEGAGEPEANSQNAAEQPAGAGQVEAQA